MNMHSPISENLLSPDWSVAQIESMRQFWNQGMPIKEIARRVGRTPGAVHRKLHRLKLKKRRAGNLKLYQAFHASPVLAEKIRINAHALGITKAEFIRRACERCPIDVVAK